MRRNVLLSVVAVGLIVGGVAPALLHGAVVEATTAAMGARAASGATPTLQIINLGARAQPDGSILYRVCVASDQQPVAGSVTVSATGVPPTTIPLSVVGGFSCGYTDSYLLEGSHFFGASPVGQPVDYQFQQACVVGQGATLSCVDRTGSFPGVNGAPIMPAGSCTVDFTVNAVGKAITPTYLTGCSGGLGLLVGVQLPATDTPIPAPPVCATAVTATSTQPSTGTNTVVPTATATNTAVPTDTATDTSVPTDTYPPLPTLFPGPGHSGVSAVGSNSIASANAPAAATSANTPDTGCATGTPATTSATASPTVAATTGAGTSVTATVTMSATAGATLAPTSTATATSATLTSVAGSKSATTTDTATSATTTATATTATAMATTATAMATTATATTATATTAAVANTATTSPVVTSAATVPASATTAPIAPASATTAPIAPASATTVRATTVTSTPTGAAATATGTPVLAIVIKTPGIVVVPVVRPGSTPTTESAATQAAGLPKSAIRSAEPHLSVSVSPRLLRPGDMLSVNAHYLARSLVRETLTYAPHRQIVLTRHADAGGNVAVRMRMPMVTLRGGHGEAMLSITATFGSRRAAQSTRLALANEILSLTGSVTRGCARDITLRVAYLGKARVQVTVSYLGRARHKTVLSTDRNGIANDRFSVSYRALKLRVLPVVIVVSGQHGANRQTERLQVAQPIPRSCSRK